ncbi:Immunity protein 63 [Clostridium cavendishii DSM 21758]|uniref:Immunity protein 63 n=1 Tax=Clostridium cavendishii DSM 21758 TaxID=1121302 RepID=A0A1M6NC10_9CLOT|nr:Imm63 family immunity protein [Clostridium cavendishii]SHJ93222.1 Immunity protein 63 [Clostridium cavendishii DSM 21758]
MINRDIIYNELKEIAKKNNIEDFQSICCGRGLDCGELCIEYNYGKYILFAYDRGNESFHYETDDIAEFKYTVFQHICTHNGFNYEVKQRKNNDSISRDNDNLMSDHRKIAFEYALHQLNKISSIWMERAIPEYEKLLNLWRKSKDVYFNRDTMEFEVKGD